VLHFILFFDYKLTLHLILRQDHFRTANENKVY
jgi:hypothetical protein